MTLAMLLVFKATLVLLVALVLDAALRRWHVLACASMWNAALAVLLLFPLAALLPPLELPLLGEGSAPVEANQDAAHRIVAAEEPPAHAGDFAFQHENNVHQRPSELIPAPASDSVATPPSVASATKERLWHHWARGHAALTLWAVGLLVVAFRLATSWFAVSRLRRRSTAVKCRDWQARLAQWQRQIGCRLAVLRQSERIDVPLVVGYFRPVILIPSGLVGSLKGRSRDAVLVHELAHVARGDYAWQLVLRVLQAALWFHPLIWLAERRIAFIRERACDDFTVHALDGDQDYAETLLAIAGRLVQRPEFGLGLAILREPRLAARLEAISTSPGNRRCRLSLPGRLLAFSLALAFAGTLGSVTIVRAQQADKSEQQARTTDQEAAGASADSPVSADESAQSKEDEERSKAGRDATEPAKDRTHPITVFGRALDQDGRPIAEAEIYLASPRTHGEPLATTKTDADGDYRFERIPLPIERADTVGRRDSGSFEVFGRAEGFGFAWRPLKSFLPGQDHAEQRLPDPTLDLPHSFGRNDPILIDLHFGPPAAIRGRIVNDLGEPIAGARLAIRNGMPWDDDRSRRQLESFNWGTLVPLSVNRTVSDERGRFAFTDLPIDCKFWIDVRPSGHSLRSICVATKEGLVADPRGQRIYSGDFEITFPRPRLVKLRVVYGDTGEPAPKVGVGGVVTEAGFWETTGEDGAVDVPLADGRYRCSVLPRYRTPYLRTYFDLDVSAETTKEPTTIKLRPAAVVDITVVDADTREPLSDVDVWLDRMVHGYRSWEVETNTSHGERPRSDKNGKMRVLFEPGTHRIGVGLQAYPEGYEPVEPDGRLIECKPGTPAAVVFEMRKRGAAGQEKAEGPAEVAADPKADRPAPAADAARKRTMKVQVLGPDDQPMAGAHIYAAIWAKDPPKGNHDYVCDASGEAMVELPKEIEILRLWARMDGHVPLFVHWWPKTFPEKPLIPDEFTFKLEIGTVIHGLVKNDAGEPIQGAKVQVNLVDRGGQPPGRSIINHWLATGDAARTTDAEGRWTLDNVPPGDVEVLLLVSHPDYVSDYEWGGLQKEQSVTAKSLRDGSGTIVMRRGIALTGTIRDANGKPVPDAVVIWGDDPYLQQGSQEVLSDAEGKYRLPPLPQGELSVTVVAEGHAPQQERMALAPDNPTADFRLQPGKMVRIQFVDPTGAALPNVAVGIGSWRGNKALYNHKHPNVLDTKIPRQANQSGLFEWPWAPDDPVTYTFYKEGFRAVESRTLTAREGFHVVIMEP